MSDEEQVYDEVRVLIKATRRDLARELREFSREAMGEVNVLNRPQHTKLADFRDAWIKLQKKLNEIAEEDE